MRGSKVLVSCRSLVTMETVTSFSDEYFLQNKSKTCFFLLDDSVQKARDSFSSFFYRVLFNLNIE